MLAAVATLPAIPVGLFLKKRLEQTLEGTAWSGAGFLVTAAVLLLTIKLKGGDKGPERTTFLDALLVGIAQMFAPLPGVSRSGLTIAAALGLGFKRTWAVGFSLLMAVPVIAGAAILELRKVDFHAMPPGRMGQIAVAAVVSFVGRLPGDRLARPRCAVGQDVVFFCIPRRPRRSRRPGLVGHPGEEPRCPPPDSSGPARSGRPARPGVGGTRRAGSGSSPRSWRSDQVSLALGLRATIGPAPRVWCWADLWRSVARGGRADAPALLSTAAVRATLREAIAEVRRDGLLLRLGPVAESPGVLRRLRARVASWTRQSATPGARRRSRAG